MDKEGSFFFLGFTAIIIYFSYNLGYLQGTIDILNEKTFIKKDR